MMRIEDTPDMMVECYKNGKYFGTMLLKTFEFRVTSTITDYTSMIERLNSGKTGYLPVYSGGYYEIYKVE